MAVLLPELVEVPGMVELAELVKLAWPGQSAGGV